jgi:hypothetical protein
VNARASGRGENLRAALLSRKRMLGVSPDGQNGVVPPEAKGIADR